MAKAKASSIITTQAKALPNKIPSIHKPQPPNPKNTPTMEENKMMLMMNFKITTPPQNSPSWKLYENPFYTSHHNSTLDLKQIHKLHLPISTRKIATSFYDLTFIKPCMESQLVMARAQITALKAELECERKTRKKMETLNKRLARELSEERKGREALEGVCHVLAHDTSSHKSMINTMKREIEEERRMLRIAEVIREERVQMKLEDAKILLEEKFNEVEMVKRMGVNGSNAKKDESDHETLDHVRNVDSTVVMKRRGCQGVENPHIKRGIKGFVEFPRVIRAIGSKHLGGKLECQKAQLKLMIKHKGHVTYNGLVAN